jgi:hypothetical protein
MEMVEMALEWRSAASSQGYALVQITNIPTEMYGYDPPTCFCWFELERPCHNHKHPEYHTLFLRCRTTV